MKLHLSLLLALLGAVAARADIVIPGANGTDGPLNITADTVIDLSQAITGQWDTNNAAHAGKGVYDSAKWAVVFKYTDVNIAAGATVTFKNHASRAPVVWLVSGYFTNSGTISLDGQRGLAAPALAEPGPGGFRGGTGFYSGGAQSSPGFGPGGGQGQYTEYFGIQGGAGSYASVGWAGSQAYGNPSLIPLLGGSGAGGRNTINGNPGGAGGGAGAGAILIACANTFFLSGTLHANGGPGNDSGGSGGGIRLVANTLDGDGLIQCLGGGGQSGGLGRVRIERLSNAASITVIPDPSVVDLAGGATALLWPPAGAPEVRVVSVGGSGAPANPRAEFGTLGADISLPATDSIQVIVETTNVERASVVGVRGIPRSNGKFTEVPAVVDTIMSDDPLVIRWKADLPVNVGYSAVQAHVVRP